MNVYWAMGMYGAVCYGLGGLITWLLMRKPRK